METAITTVTAPIFNVQATHPRACASCARAKAKCVSEDNGKCQRCHRLKKICEPHRTQPRNQPRKRRSETASRSEKSHVAKLEEKLDGLVTLLQENQEKAGNETFASMNFNTAPIPSRSLDTLTTVSQSSHGENPEQGWIHLEITNSTPSSQPSQTPAGWPVPTNPSNLNQPGPPILERVDYSSEEANFLLNRWRDQMASFFPFIVVDPSLSAQDLQRDRPYLLKSILVVAQRDCDQQLALGTWFVRHLAERMALNGERNLDLLLAMLTYLGWCIHNCYNIPQLGCLLGVGTALVFDLGLHRLPQSNRSPFDIPTREISHNSSVKRTVEERRALLALFVICSTASKLFRGKINNSLTITPYISECLDILEKAQDHPNDACATSIVRLQIIVERIGQAPWNTDYGLPEYSVSSLPAVLYVKSIQEQLKDYKSKMGPEVSTRGFMLLQYYHTEQCLYEVGLSRSHVLSNSPSHDFHRLEMLHACLESNKMFFEVLFAIPEYRYLSFSLGTWAHVSHSIMTLRHLSTFEHPDWNLAYVRETNDFLKMMEKLTERFNKVAGQTFVRTTIKLASLRANMQDYWEKKEADANGHGLDSLSGQDADMGRPWEPYDFLDDSWLADVLGPMEFQLNNRDTL